MTPRKRSVIAVALLAQTVAVGTTIGSFTLFVQPIAAEFEATRFQVSLGISFMTAMLGLGGVFIGPVLDRGRIRRAMLIGCSVQVASLLVASVANDLLILGALALVVGFAMPTLGPVTSSALVGKVFDEDRGRALGIVNMGAPLGGLVFALIAGVTLETWGWRGTYVLFAAIAASTTLPCVMWLVPAPADLLALAPPGGAPAGESAPKPRGAGELFRNPVFICSALPFGILIGCATGWSAHLAPYLDGLGGSTRMVALTVAVSMGMGMMGTLVFGVLVERFSPRSLLFSMLAITSIGFLVLSTQPSLGVAVPTVVLAGLCAGGFLPVFVSLLADRFGTASLGRTMGLSNAFILPFGFAVPPSLGAIYDSQGGYTLAFFLLIGLYAVAAIALSRLRAAPSGAREAGESA